MKRRIMIDQMARMDCEEWHKHLSDCRFIYDRISEDARNEYRAKAYEKWTNHNNACEG